jgi:hypothetical protein
MEFHKYWLVMLVYSGSLMVSNGFYFLLLFFFFGRGGISLRCALVGYYGAEAEPIVAFAGPNTVYLPGM